MWNDTLWGSSLSLIFSSVILVSFFMLWNIDERLGKVRVATFNCFVGVSFGDILCICALSTFGPLVSVL